MATDRRVVRVAPAFFEQLDQQLGSDRGPNGEASATDFLVFDLPTIVDEFAARFDELQEAIAGAPAARMLIGTGRLVRAFVVYGLLSDDDAVDLIGIEVDT